MEDPPTTKARSQGTAMQGFSFLACSLVGRFRLTVRAAIRLKSPLSVELEYIRSHSNSTACSP